MKLKPAVKALVERSGIPSEAEITAASSLLQSLSLTHPNLYQFLSLSSIANQTQTQTQTQTQKAPQMNDMNQKESNSEERVERQLNEILSFHQPKTHHSQKESEPFDNITEDSENSDEISTEFPEDINLNIESSDESEDTTKEREENPHEKINQTIPSTSSHNTSAITLSSLSSSPPFPSSQLSSSLQPSSSSSSKENVTSIYDPFKRDPQYAQSTSTSLWELVHFFIHGLFSLEEEVRILFSDELFIIDNWGN
jgi:myosin heavy subunit